jgi:outer membrane protein assembly factor BamB
VAWDIPLGGGRLVTAGDTLFVVTGEGVLRALDAATGSALWSVSMPGATEVAVAGGRAFVSTPDRNVTAVDIDTGARLWRTPTLGVPGPPTVVGDLVYVIGSDNRLTTYDAATGAATAGFPVGENGRLTVSATDGSLYIRSGTPADGFLLQAHNRGGILRWSTVVPTPTTAMVAEGRVYVAGRAFDQLTGDLLWAGPSADFYASLAYAEGTVYGLRTFGLGVTALDPVTGVARWTTNVGDAFPTPDEGPAVTDGLVWVSAGRQVKALDAATGAILWASDPSIQTAEALMPIVAGGRVFSFTQLSGRLVAWKLP